MTLKDFVYYGARIVVHGEDKKTIEASVYPHEDDIEFTRGTFSRVKYNQMLDKLRDRALEEAR